MTDDDLHLDDLRWQANTCSEHRCHKLLHWAADRIAELERQVEWLLPDDEPVQDQDGTWVNPRQYMLDRMAEELTDG